MASPSYQAFIIHFLQANYSKQNYLWNFPDYIVSLVLFSKNKAPPFKIGVQNCLLSHILTIFQWRWLLKMLQTVPAPGSFQYLAAFLEKMLFLGFLVVDILSFHVSALMAPLQRKCLSSTKH